MLNEYFPSNKYEGVQTQTIWGRSWASCRHQRIGSQKSSAKPSQYTRWGAYLKQKRSNIDCNALFFYFLIDFKLVSRMEFAVFKETCHV